MTSYEIATTICERRKQKKILLVEDNYVDAELSKHHLEKLGCNVTHVSSGEAAVEESKRADYDLVITDVCLVGMNGIEASDIIHRNKPKLPVVVSTGSYESSSVVDALKRGFIVLPKPFQSETLNAIAEGLGLIRASLVS